MTTTATQEISTFPLVRLVRDFDSIFCGHRRGGGDITIHTYVHTPSLSGSHQGYLSAEVLLEMAGWTLNNCPLSQLYLAPHTLCADPYCAHKDTGSNCIHVGSKHQRLFLQLNRVGGSERPLEGAVTCWSAQVG